MTAWSSSPLRGCSTRRQLTRSYGSNLKDGVVANTLSQEDNVRQVVGKVQRGEADAAVVYSTDAIPQIRDQLHIMQVPDPLETLAAYPIAADGTCRWSGASSCATQSGAVISPRPCATA